MERPARISDEWPMRLLPEKRRSAGWQDTAWGIFPYILFLLSCTYGIRRSPDNSRWHGFLQVWTLFRSGRILLLPRRVVYHTSRRIDLPLQGYKAFSHEEDSSFNTCGISAIIMPVWRTRRLIMPFNCHWYRFRMVFLGTKISLQAHISISI